MNYFASARSPGFSRSGVATSCRIRAWVALAGAIGALAQSADGRVVINELMYHAPDDLPGVEFVELYNPDTQAVDLSGWTLTPGIEHRFPAGSKIEARGFVVLARDAQLFRQFYEVPVAGTFRQKLSNGGERLRLINAAGEVVDAVRYASHAPWPAGAAGESGSLERISPQADGENPANWISSPLSPDHTRPAGTPGRANAGFSATLPAVISDVTFSPKNPEANQPLDVEAVVQEGEGVLTVRLLYRLAGPGAEQPEAALAMTPVTGQPTRYRVKVPGQSGDQLLRFRVEAVDGRGARRVFPAETEPRPALSSYVRGTISAGKIPFAWIIHTTEAERKMAQQMVQSGGGPGGFNQAEMIRFQIRMILGLGVDLAGLWSDLTLSRPVTPVELQKLRPIFAAQMADRQALVEKTAAAEGDMDQRMQGVMALGQTTRAAVVAALEPALTETQRPALRTWRDAGRGFGGPGTMVKQMLDLDEEWYAVTGAAELEPERFEKLRQDFAGLRKERDALAEVAPELMRQEEGFEKVRERVEALQEKLAKVREARFGPAERQALEAREAGPGFGFGPRRRAPSSSASGAPDQYQSAVVYFDPARREWSLFDFVRAVPRSGGWKVKLGPGQALLGMTSVNFIFEYNDRFVLAESLAYEVYRRAGMAAEQSFHVRVWLNGQPLGYQLLVEQPNRAFLRRSGLRDDGHLYKIIWQEQTVVGGHEKKTRVHQGHDDVVALIEALEKTKGDEQWAVIRQHFDVEQVATYFAVNMVLSHWDGYFNNYFTYHDAQGSGKWTMYPWDQDKTWGFHDGLQPGEVFVDLPLTFGMEGDAPPGMEGRPRPRRGFGFGGGTAWWRQGGFFSRPLLANPAFRKIFLSRTREILEKVYTQDAFFPVINAMGERLQEEVRERARILRQNPEDAVQTLQTNLRDLREHLTKRREFLLAQPELARK